MDAGFKSKRMFPGFTLAELKERVGKVDDATKRAKMEAEIVARENGTSKGTFVPQRAGGVPIFRVGRM